MVKKQTAFVLGILFLCLLASCSFIPEEANSSQAPVTQVQPGNAPMNIPCFGCHSYDRYKDAAAFPHDMHKDMGLHCNQCHVIRSHDTMELNSTTCKSCHNLGKMKLSLTAMPAMFNHESHASMFGCNDCHKDTFRMKVDSARITMASIAKGKYCGTCHNGRAAFSSTECNACHTGV